MVLLHRRLRSPTRSSETLIVTLVGDWARKIRKN